MPFAAAGCIVYQLTYLLLIKAGKMRQITDLE